MVAFLLLNGGAVVAAVLIATALGLGRRRGRLLLGTLSGYLVLIHSLILGAGLLGQLTVRGVARLLAVAMVGAVWTAYRMTPDQARARQAHERLTPHHDRSCRPVEFAAATLLAPLAAIVLATTWTWPHLFEATRLWIWDDYTYHMVYPALWLREHTIAAVASAHAFTMQAWYPLSASVVAAWFMLPFPGMRGDALAWVSLTGPLYAGIVAAGVAELLARLGCRSGAWAVPLVLFATSDRIAIMASSFSDADLAQAAALFAAFVFAVPRGDVEGGREVGADAVHAGLLSGVALGVKVSAATPALIVLIMMLLRVRATSSAPALLARVAGGGMPPRAPGAGSLTAAPGASRSVGGILAVFTAAWAVTGGYWYARSAIHTGNPLYPAAFFFWPGATFPETTLREYSRVYGVGRTVADALAVYLSWPRFHAALAVAGLLGLAIWLLVRRRGMTRSQSYFGCGALAIAAIVLLLLPVMPYSAGNAMTFRSGVVHWDSLRYVALLPLLGWAALGFLLDAGAGSDRGRTLAALGIVAGAVWTSEATRLTAPVVWIVALLVAAILACLRWRAGSRLATLQRVRSYVHDRRCPGRIQTLAVATAAILVLGILAWSHGSKAAATTAAFYREPLFGPALAVLDRQPAGTRVAVFGDQWVYPTFGARDHLRPVRLDRDGRIATKPIGDAMGPGNLTVDPRTFRSNLRASGVGLVVVVHLPHPGRSPDWPMQHAALDAAGDARLLYRDRAVAVWELGAAARGGHGARAAPGGASRPLRRAGAGVLAARLAGHDIDRVLVDVSPYSFGPSYVGLLDGVPDEHCYHPIIPRNTPLPASRTDTYSTMFDNQEAWCV